MIDYEHEHEHELNPQSAIRNPQLIIRNPQSTIQLWRAGTGGSSRRWRARGCWAGRWPPRSGCRLGNCPIIPFCATETSSLPCPTRCLGAIC